uniref:Hypoxanthine phosphoribosyltransferase n=1 Tax=Trichuris muris TaxID=70415 RepID=A0A5S6QSU2_TRIMR
MFSQKYLQRLRGSKRYPSDPNVNVSLRYSSRSPFAAAYMESGVVVLSDDFQGYPVHDFVISESFSPYVECVLIKQDEIRRRTDALTRDVQEMYGTHSLGLICILNGAFRFFSLFTESLMKRRQSVGAATFFDFIRVKSYVNSSSSSISVGSSVQPTFTGLHTLIVEDIVDTGRTLEKLYELVSVYKPLSVRTVSLLSKRLSTPAVKTAEFVGFEVPDRFVVGFGFDYNEHFRDLNDVCVLSEEGRRKFNKSDCW